MSFWGITAFFNPTHSKTRVENLRRFVEGVQAQGLKLMIVELCSDDGQDHSEQWKATNLAGNLIFLSGGALCWQKERLLQIGLEQLPWDCDEVAWLDGDVLFLNDGWVRDAELALGEYNLIQLFDRVVSDGKTSTGMIAHREMTTAKPGRSVVLNGGIPDALYGRSGYAWAARREVIDRVGFYDKCIVGGGDAVMAYAGFNRIWPTLDQAREIFTPEQFLDIALYIERFHEAVQGKIGYVPGTILHLDHGSEEGRAYQTRTEILKRNGFSPADLKMSDHGPWEWATEKDAMHAEIARYFERRAD